MLQPLRSFLNRPIAEEFSFSNHFRQSLQAGLYVFVFVTLLNGGFGQLPMVGAMTFLSMGVVVTVLIANVFIPRLLPSIYDEDRWTVGRHILHVLWVLFLISCSNELILKLLNLKGPTFGDMYLYVTLIGFFPIMLGVFLTEQRRLKRNLAQAQTLNTIVSHRSEPSTKTLYQSVDPTPERLTQPSPILFIAENGKDRLSLQPDQLIYVESVGNYVDIHWRNAGQLQKTVLRSTLKEIADSLSHHPQFFRCHRAFLVNLQAISQTEGNARGYQLMLTGVTSKIPVSRNYLDAFDERLEKVTQVV